MPLTADATLELWTPLGAIPQPEVSRAQLAGWMRAAGFAQAEDIKLVPDKYVLLFKRSRV